MRLLLMLVMFLIPLKASFSLEMKSIAEEVLGKKEKYNEEELEKRIEREEEARIATYDDFLKHDLDDSLSRNRRELVKGQKKEIKKSRDNREPKEKKKTGGKRKKMGKTKVNDKSRDRKEPKEKKTGGRRKKLGKTNDKEYSKKSLGKAKDIKKKGAKNKTNDKEEKKKGRKIENRGRTKAQKKKESQIESSERSKGKKQTQKVNPKKSKKADTAKKSMSSKMNKETINPKKAPKKGASKKKVIKEKKKQEKKKKNEKSKEKHRSKTNHRKKMQKENKEKPDKSAGKEKKGKKNKDKENTKETGNLKKKNNKPISPKMRKPKKGSDDKRKKQPETSERQGETFVEICNFTKNFFLTVGEPVTFFSSDNGEATKCKVNFKAPKLTEVGITCDSFDLNFRGCGKEKLVIRGKTVDGKKKIKHCREDAPLGVEISTNKLKVLYKKKEGVRSSGFVCTAMAEFVSDVALLEAAIQDLRDDLQTMATIQVYFIDFRQFLVTLEARLRNLGATSRRRRRRDIADIVAFVERIVKIVDATIGNNRKALRRMSKTLPTLLAGAEEVLVQLETNPSSIDVTALLITVSDGFKALDAWDVEYPVLESDLNDLLDSMGIALVDVGGTTLGPVTIPVAPSVFTPAATETSTAPSVPTSTTTGHVTETTPTSTSTTTSAPEEISDPRSSLIADTLLCADDQCFAAPEDICVALPGLCCDEWICGDWPTQCTANDGRVFNISDRWQEDCENCNCYFNSIRGATVSCYPVFCPGKPHRDCTTEPSGSDECCKQHSCSQTTCLDDGRYYAIDEEWESLSDPCLTCKCVKDGDNSPVVECDAEICDKPPSPDCRAIKPRTECCAVEWDCTNDYVITFPKKWIRGGTSSICVFAIRNKSISSKLTVSWESDLSSGTIGNLDKTAEGPWQLCTDVNVPDDSQRNIKLKITGEVDTTKVNETLKITLEDIHKTYVQTDKYRYLPGQTVHFRILTISGPTPEVSYSPVEEIWVTSPSESRIFQWLDVDNSQGIVQLEFPLAEEAEEGTYTVFVLTDDKKADQQFLVEPYVLPRFEVSIALLSYVLTVHKEIRFTVCADYTFGQPVTGTASLTVKENCRYFCEKVASASISITTFKGCTTAVVLTKDIGNVANYGFYRGLIATVTFTEEGTGAQGNASIKFSVNREAVSFTRINEDYYKRGLPYIFQVRASLPDNSVAVDEVVSVCILDSCKEFTIDSTGILTAILPPHLMAARTPVSVNALTHNYDSGSLGQGYASRRTFRIQGSFSPSNSSLSFLLPSNTIACVPGEGSTVILPVMFVANDTSSALLRTQVISRSLVLSTSSQEYNLEDSTLPLNVDLMLETLQDLEEGLVRGFLNIELSISALASPIVHVLIWYSRADGEVVSAYGRLDAAQCLNNPTTLEWSALQDPSAPKDDVSLTIRSTPNSVCGLSVVDRSVEILGREQSDRLTIASIFTAIGQAEHSSWENLLANDYYYCNGQNYYYYYFPFFAFEEDFVRTTRNEDGIDRQRRSPYYYGGRLTDYVDAIKSFDDAGMQIMTDLTLETRPCNPRTFGGFPEYLYFDGGFPLGTIAAGNVETTSDLDEAASSEEDESETEVRAYFPETWLWQLTVIGDSGEKVEELTLPDTITEWVGDVVCAHPVKGVGLGGPATITTFIEFFMDVTKPPVVRQGERVPIIVSVFNFQNEDLPVKVTLEPSSSYNVIDNSKSVCAPANDKETAQYVVVPLETGNVNLSFVATVVEGTLECGGGSPPVTKSDSLISSLRVIFEGVVKEKVNSDYFCAGDSPVTWLLESPAEIVEGSDRASMSVTTDLIGPTLDNLDNLIQMPYGCGEQLMINFAPNIFIMRYLVATSQATLETTQKLERFMIAGYQGELTYQRDDGSFSAFGNNDQNGSTFLTAFVYKSFVQASSFITIDKTKIDISRKWLLSHQDIFGCFLSVGFVHSHHLKGGLSGDTKNASVTLSAYVIIALLEADPDTPVDTTCITEDTQATDVYSESLKAYALSLSGSSEAEAHITSAYDSLIGDAENVDSGIQVEAMGYVLLAMMKDKDNYVLQTLTLAKMLTGKRNGGGGFTSTQDTVVALQALAEYSEVYSQTDTDLTVTGDAAGEILTFQATFENRLLLQTQSINEQLPLNVSVSVTGSGCAVVMVVHRYNIPEVPSSSAFNLNVAVTQETCTLFQLKLCFSYLLPDASNMAILEIELTSGYSPVSDDLQKLVDDGTIKKFENNDVFSVNLYLDSVTPEEVCVTFGMKEDMLVEDYKPGTASLYDYYIPEWTITKAIVIEKEC